MSKQILSLPQLIGTRLYMHKIFFIKLGFSYMKLTKLVMLFMLQLTVFYLDHGPQKFIVVAHGH